MITAKQTDASLRKVVKLGGFLMLAITAWTAIALNVGLKHFWSSAGLSLSDKIRLLFSSQQIIPGYSPILLVTKINDIVIVACALLLSLTGLATLFGRQWGVKLGAGAAAVMSGFICLDAIQIPLHMAFVPGVEALILVIIMGLPFLTTPGRLTRGRIVRTCSILLSYWAALIVAYYVNLFTQTSSQIRAMAPISLNVAAQGLTKQDMSCQWSPRHWVCVPSGYIPLSPQGKYSFWKDQKGAIISVNPSTIFSGMHKPSDGFFNAYSYEKAVLNAHFYPGDLVRMKQVILGSAYSARELYAWKSRYSRGFLAVSKWGAKIAWHAYADVYPVNSQPYQIYSTAATRKHALLPLLASFAMATKN